MRKIALSILIAAFALCFSAVPALADNHDVDVNMDVNQGADTDADHGSDLHRPFFLCAWGYAWEANAGDFSQVGDIMVRVSPEPLFIALGGEWGADTVMLSLGMAIFLLDGPPEDMPFNTYLGAGVAAGISGMSPALMPYLRLGCEIWGHSKNSFFTFFPVYVYGEVEFRLALSGFDESFRLGFRWGI